MPLVTEALATWAADEPRYKAFGLELEPLMAVALHQVGIAYERLSVRTKDRDSLARKIVRKSYGDYAQITDKLGARVVVRLPPDVDRATECLLQRFGGAVEDKRSALDVDKFDYRSVHLQIDGASTDWRFEGLGCEIQIRTVTEDAWATMSHFLAYKNVSETPFLRRRALAALAALFELADARYEQMQQEIQSDPDYEPQTILDAIEGSFLRAGGGGYDRLLSLEVIESLRPAYGPIEARRIGRTIAEWSDASDGWLAALLRRAEVNDNPFAGQPEALMIGHLLSIRSNALLALWSEHYDPDEPLRNRGRALLYSAWLAGVTLLTGGTSCVP